MSKWPTSILWMVILNAAVVGSYIMHLATTGEWLALAAIPLAVATVAIWYRIEHR